MKWKVVLTALMLAITLSAYGEKPPAGKATAPEKIKISEQKLLTLRMKGPYQLMNKAFGEVYMAMGKLGLRPAGTPFAIYFNNPTKVKPAEYDWEVCVPVDRKAKPKAPVKFRIQKAMEAVSLVYTGPYGTKEHTGCYSKLIAFGSSLKGYISGPPREVYHEMKGFQGGKKNVTQIYFPVEKK